MTRALIFFSFGIKAERLTAVFLVNSGGDFSDDTSIESLDDENLTLSYYFEFNMSYVQSRFFRKLHGVELGSNQSRELDRIRLKNVSCGHTQCGALPPVCGATQEQFGL